MGRHTRVCLTPLNLFSKWIFILCIYLCKHFAEAQTKYNTRLGKRDAQFGAYPSPISPLPSFFSLYFYFELEFYLPRHFIPLGILFLRALVDTQYIRLHIVHICIYDNTIHIT